MTRQRHRQHGNPFNIRGDIAVPAWPLVFARPAPFALDIGFGGGRFLLELAARHPEWNVLGLEIRTFFVEDVLARGRAEGRTNLHALIANANTHLAALVPDGSVAFVSLNFPDPWFKKRHHKRRVLNEPWLDLLTRKLQPGGELHYVSDHEPAALEALALLQRHPAFVSDTPGFATTSTTGIATERELTHERRGDAIYRLCYRLDR